MTTKHPLDSPETREPTVIFLHIGKTGGSTLRKIVDRNFRQSEVLPIQTAERQDTLRPRRERSLEDLAAVSPARLQRARVIKGHMIFGGHAFIQGPSTYVTLMREPVALAVSQYRYVLRTAGHRLHETVISAGMSLDEYVRSGVSLEVDNSQTRVISGDVSTPFGEVTTDMLETAKVNIEEWFSLVGLTERFDESIVLLQELFGWSKLRYVRVKVAPKSQNVPVDAETIRFLEELNRFDSELYSFAERRLDEAISRYPSFERDLARAKKMNALYRPWGTARYTIPKWLVSRYERKL